MSPGAFRHAQRAIPVTPAGSTRVPLPRELPVDAAGAETARSWGRA